MFLQKFLLSVLTIFLVHPLHADEGMWTLDNLPEERLKEKYDFKANPTWVKKVQLSSVRLANGCSGSFISKEGLLMTNHHCARGCIQNLSSKKNDFISSGFHAKARGDEKKCPAFEVNRLVDVSDVTENILEATKDKEGKAYSDAKKAKMAELEKACAKNSEDYRCDTVSLYHGGEYKLYKYRRYQDVRLVFAPEDSIAAFGGDPDNFNFPRYSMDMTFLRVYEKGKPLENKYWFPWAEEGAKKGDMTFITGHPGSTDRLLPTSMLKYYRDHRLVESLIRLAEMRGLLDQYAKKSKEAARISRGHLKGVENGFKALTGRLKALNDDEFFTQLLKKERDLKYRVRRNRWYKNKYGDAWKNIEKAIERKKNLEDEFSHIAFSNYGTKLFSYARTLVQYAEEIEKPNKKRFREFTDAKLPRTKQYLFSKAPIYKDFERTLMEHSLTKMREHLSPDHSFVKLALGKQSPEELSQELVKKTKLDDVAYRKKLFEGGKKAILSSKDPMIEFAIKLDDEARKYRKIEEEEISPIFSKNQEKIAKAIFDIYGKDNYPDATFSLRLSYGQVKGFPDNGKYVEPTTEIAGVFKRATGREPFDLPKSWIKNEKSLDKNTPFNFVSTNDIIGGNSGSPVINRKAEIIGLVFDGNIYSLGGAYGFDEKQNRAVSVHGDLILEALEKVYKADTLVEEIKESQGGDKKMAAAQ